MRKVLENQTGFSRKTAEDARRRRMDSQVRRTHRRAVRQRKRYLQSPQYRAIKLMKEIDWKRFAKFIDELGVKLARWQENLFRNLIEHPELRRVTYSYPLHSGKTQTQKVFDQYAWRKQNELEIATRGQEKAALQVVNPNVSRKYIV